MDYDDYLRHCINCGHSCGTNDVKYCAFKSIIHPTKLCDLTSCPKKKVQEKKTISVETRDLMIDFAAHCMNMKNDDWHHSIDVDIDFAKENISGFMESRYITVDIEQ